MTGLRQWLRCLTGVHEWVEFATDEGDVFTFCLHCGCRD